MRFIVVGTSGAGKSTFARALASALQCPHVELDALYWGPHWKAKAPAEFERLARAAVQGERWVVDGNYAAVRAIVWPRATHVVWLNFGRTTILLRLLGRTVRRAFSREPLWHGNRESLRTAFFSRRSILLWSATTYGPNRIKYTKLRQDNAFAQLEWIELGSAVEAEALLARLASQARGDDV